MDALALARFLTPIAIAVSLAAFVELLAALNVTRTRRAALAERRRFITGPS
jgi:hypothetical protein